MPTLKGTSRAETLDIRGQTADYTVDGRGGNDTIYGGSGHDKLYGGGGSDLIYASANDTFIDGGAGVDTVNFSYSATGVRVVLWDGGLGVWPEPNPASPTYHSNVLLRVENVVGSNSNDYLYGSNAVNALSGGAGNDSLYPNGTGDFLTGGTGADKFVAGAATSKVTITDFHYNEGDRIDWEGTLGFRWVKGSAPDANGTIQEAWIGTCDLQFGGTFQLIVLGADTPSTNWFI